MADALADPGEGYVFHANGDSGGGWFDSDALIAAGFDIQFGDDGDIGSIEPPSNGVSIFDAKGNQIGSNGSVFTEVA